MNRRRFIRSMSAAAGLTAAGPYVRNAYAAESVAGSSRINLVVVIGAGIVGASIAYNHSRRGWLEQRGRLTILTEFQPR